MAKEVIIPYKLLLELSKYPRIGETQKVFSELSRRAPRLEKNFIVLDSDLKAKLTSYGVIPTFKETQSGRLRLESLNFPGLVLDPSFFKDFYKSP